MEPEIRAFAPPQSLVHPARLLVGVGAATVLAGLLTDPSRIWVQVLLVGLYLTGLALAGMVFVAIQHALGAGWATVLRRVPEALFALLPVGAVLVLAALLFGGRTLYPWMSAAHGHGHALTGFKAVWLQPGPFYLRAVVYVAVWLGFAHRLRRLSLAQDRSPSLLLYRRATRTSIAFLIAFGITLSAAAIDWVMSLEPHWFSTIFGVYHFAGLFASGLAAIALLVLWLSAEGPLAALLSTAHLQDLGKLMFAFSTFWMYIWFCQFMLIWYSNLPEETAYYAPRTTGGWGAIFLANAVVNWVVPFVVLLGQAAKGNRKILARIAGLLLVGRWIDLYLMIAPPVVGAEPGIGGWEVGMALGGLGLVLLVVSRAFASAPPVPIGDPLLTESLHHH